MVTGNGSGVAPEPLIFESFYWGLLSAVSLNIGSLVGVTCLPGKKVRAILMSFGGGALLFALSIELFGHVLHASEVEGSTAPVWVMEGTAVLGGLFFALLNYMLNLVGADLRKVSTTKSRFARLRRLLMRRLAWRLLKIPFFSALNVDELKDLIQSAMYKERFRQDDVILSGELGSACGIYFILSGTVRVTIGSQELGKPIGELCSKENMSKIAGIGSLPKSFTVGLESIAQESPASPWPEEEDEEWSWSWDLGANQIFGDMAVLAGSTLRLVAVAETPVKVLTLPGHEVAHLLEVNSRVRDQAVLRAVQGLTQFQPMQDVPETAFRTLASSCDLRRCRAGEHIFLGDVTKETSILCVMLGRIEVKDIQTGKKTFLHAGSYCCLEHLESGLNSPNMKVKALESATILAIPRKDIDMVLKESADLVIFDDDGFAEQSQLPGQVSKMPSTSNSPVISDVSTAASSRESPRHSVLSCPVLKTGGSRLSELNGTCEEGGIRAESQPPSRRSLRTTAWSSSDPETMAIANLGWEEGPEKKNEELQPIINMQLNLATCFHHVSDADLAEQDFPPKSPSRKSSKRCSQVSIGTNEPMIEAEDGPQSAVTTEERAPAQNRAVMVWLGILIDAVPESLVIGIIINKSAAGNDGDNPSLHAAAAALPFVIGVFISNLPESMSSSGSMKAHGMKVSTILLMWLGTTVLTATGSVLGALLFPPGSDDRMSTNLAVVAVEGLAAGAMLTMIAQTMMPEAFEQGGDVVGLSCLAGFLCALSVKLIPIGDL